MKYFAIFLPLFFIGFIGVVFPQTLAMCDYNKDWPQAPCLDTPPYTIEEKKLAWDPYYEYKGSVWMEEKKLEMINALETGTFHEWVEKPDDYSHWNVYEYYSIFEGFDYENYPQESVEQKLVTPESVIPPPLKQMKLGIKLGHIICDKDKNPVWNIHFKPACVFPDSEMKLLERGWAKLRLVLPGSGDPIKELEWTGQNEVTYRILGNIRYGDEPPPSTLDEKKKIVWEYAQQYHPGERFLEYSIPTSGMYHFNVGDKVQFDLLEWGNYSECWNLKLRIIDIHDQPVYEDNSVRFCLEPPTDGQPGWFASYSMGQEFEEFVCDKAGYYRIEVSNGEVFSPTIIQNFACLDTESKIEPSTKIEISFGKPTASKLLPVVFNEITTFTTENLNKITVWNFELIGHSGDDRGLVWDRVPRGAEIWYEITNGNGQDIVDHARMSENWAIPSDQYVYEMDCGLFHIEGESANPSSFPIKSNADTINAKNSWMGIYPNSSGEYSFEFASIFETSVKLPEGAKVISQESKQCKLTQNIEGDERKYTDGYYTKIVFRLE